MLSAPLRADEAQRLEALRALDILDTPEEPLYDELTTLAAQVCGTPIALVSLVDEHRQWFKSHIGLAARETGRVESFCAHAVTSRAPLIVPDVLADARFHDNPLVTGEPHIRSYAGVPLFTRSGHALGTLCVINQVAHGLSAAQIGSLKALARQVEVLLELRATRLELKRREHALSQFEELLGEAQMVSDSLLWDWDIRTGAMKYSRSYSELMGYPATDDDQHFDLWVERTHPEDGASTWALINAHLKGQTTKYEAQYRQRHAQGHWVWLHSRGRVIERDEAGRAVRMVGVVTNIDRHKRIEQQLEQANAELGQQVRRAEALLRSKSQFLANVAHEIRTPLNSIVGAAQLALMAPHPEQQRQDVAMVNASAQALLELVNRVLDVSRLEAGALALERAPMSLHAMAQALQQQFGVQARQRGLTMRVTVTDNVPSSILGDSVRVQQILSNLLSNAFKFTEHGEVRLHMDAPPGENDRARVLVLTVADTGMGMSDEQMARLFTPFQQGDDSIARRFGGTGLGLYICRELLALMGGQLTVTSQPGQGSEFVARLPCEVGDASAAPERSAPQPVSALTADALAQDLRDAASDMQGARVLVVDDNPMNRVVAQRFLRQAGLQPVAVESAHEAIQAVTQSRFDAVLMDLYMPDLNGDDATRRLRQMGHALPIIAVSASATPEETRRCLEAGMNSFLAKPIDALAMLQELRKQLRAPLGFLRRDQQDEAAGAVSDPG